MIKLALATAAAAALVLAGSASSATPAAKLARFAPAKAYPMPHIKERGQLSARPVSEH